MLPTIDALILGNAWLYFPVALFVGVLSGLQTGHGKTTMTAFITAIKGSVKDAVLLAISAAISQTAVAWLLACVVFYFLPSVNSQHRDPYFQVFTGFSIIILAGWILFRARQAQLQRLRSRGNGPHQGMMYQTDNYWVEICIFKQNATPRFRLYFYDLAQKPTSPLSPSKIIFKIVRPDGTFQIFDFFRLEQYLEATELVAEPHEFEAILQFRQSDHGFIYKVRFVEFLEEELALENDKGVKDVFGREQIVTIQKHFAGREVSAGQIIKFGLTSGFLASPEAFAVMLVSFQFTRADLGFWMMLIFTFALAAVLIGVGVMTAFYLRNVHQLFRDIFDMANRLTYASSVILFLIGLMVVLNGMGYL